MILDHLEKAPEATLARLAEIGYREVEAIGGYVASGVDLRRMIEQAELACPSVHMQFERGEIEVQLEEACSLGVQYVVSPVLFPSCDARDDPVAMYRELNSLTADEFRKIGDRANELGRRARDMGLRYVYHNHNFEFRSLGSGLNGYSILLANTDPDLVYFEADCGWMAAAGVSPVDVLRSFPGRFPLLHIKEFDRTDSIGTSIGTCPRSAALGHGQMDYRALLRQAIELGSEHIFVEQEPPFSAYDSLEAAAADYEYLHASLSSGARRK